MQNEIKNIKRLGMIGLILGLSCTAMWLLVVSIGMMTQWPSNGLFVHLCAILSVVITVVCVGILITCIVRKKKLGLKAKGLIWRPVVGSILAASFWLVTLAFWLIDAIYWNIKNAAPCPAGQHKVCPFATKKCDCWRDGYIENVDKPIIYLYPEEEIEVSVTLGFPEFLTTIYPTYNGGWRVLAHPDGTLTDLATGRNLYALYWEGKAVGKSEINEGFVVAGKDSAHFLEEKLAILGLSEYEAEEFIVYWLPKLESSPYNLIRFETAEEIEENMPLTVSPTPNTTIRVMMDFTPLEEEMSIPEQILPEAPAREGFVVIEWGGSEISR